MTAKPGSKSPVRDGVWKCKGKGCRKQFTVRIGTIFEESKIPLCKWPVERVDAKTLHGLVRNHVDSKAAVITDDLHHQMSKKHLHRYCNERSFMWDNRKVSDGERMVAAIEGAEGKRLMYREPTT